MADNFRKTIALDAGLGAFGRSATFELVLSPDRVRTLLAVRDQVTAMAGVGAQVAEIVVAETAVQPFPDDLSVGTVSIRADGFVWSVKTARSRVASREASFSVDAAEIEGYAVAAGLIPEWRRKGAELPVTNEVRAWQVEEAVRSFVGRAGIRPLDQEDVATVAGDMISSLLHWAAEKAADPEKAIEAVGFGVGCFMSERFAVDGQAASDDFVVDLKVGHEPMGVEATYYTGNGADLFVDDELLAEHRADRAAPRPSGPSMR